MIVVWPGRGRAPPNRRKKVGAWCFLGFFGRAAFGAVSCPNIQPPQIGMYLSVGMRRFGFNFAAS